MADKSGNGKGGYEKYVNYKWLALAVAAFSLLLLVPLPASMLDVAVEYSAGEKYVLDFFARELFEKPSGEAEQWQVLGVQIMEKSMRQGALGRKAVLRLDQGKLKKLGLAAPEAHLQKFRDLVESMPDDRFYRIMAAGQRLRQEQLSYQQLKPAEREKADKAAWNLKVCVALVAFVVVCFITEAIPLPGVAFCIGLILVFFGVVSREDVASLFWSDAAWFIMGSLMFAAAFVKTGVDKRICLAIFRVLAKRNIKWITAMLILVI